MNHCRDCRWWDGPKEWKPEQGQCIRYQSMTVGVDELKVQVPGDESGFLYTASDFGCMQWESKNPVVCATDVKEGFGEHWPDFYPSN